MSKRILVWFRNDLRLHDNEMLVEAIAKSESILPLYIFDPRLFGETKFRSLKMGSIRAKFMLESVLALRTSLKAIGGNLLVLSGKPEEIIPQIAKDLNITEVYHHREVADEETKVSTLVENGLWKHQINLKHFIGHTLYNKEDLPFPIKDIPDQFTQFKKKVERDAIIKPCFDAPNEIRLVPAPDWGDVPSLQQMGLSEPRNDKRSAFVYRGGELEGLIHLQAVVSDVDSVPSLKKIILASRLSAWLAMGCISPRKVYWQIKKMEITADTKAVFNHILLGLLWRDYFRFMFKKYGNIFFKAEGFTDLVPNTSENEVTNFSNWKNGNTGFKVIDAIMTELRETGYINNLARQASAIYLIYNLEVRWVLGAAYFEEKLIDYNPASNWGSWLHVAGVGNDKKIKSTYNLDKSIKLLDPKGDYAMYWAS